MGVTEIVLACIGSSGLFSLISLCLQRHWARKDKRDAAESEESKLIKLLIDHERVMTIDRLTWLGKKYISAGEISLQDKTNFMEMYDSAKKLGMNGHCAQVREEVDKLQVV